MSDAAVALQPAEDESGEARLRAALSSGAAIRASALGAPPPGGWFLFDTPHGAAAFRPVSLGGLAVSAPREDDGARAAQHVERAEETLTMVEAALGVAIEPTGIGPAPMGLAVLIEHDGADGQSVTALTVPKGLASALPPASAPPETVLHRVRLAAPVLEASEIPASGDLLLLGGQAPCELSPQKPAGAAGFAATLGVGETGGAQAAPGAGGGVVAFEALLTPGQQTALRGGALLVVGPGPAPAATYAAGETVRTGAVVAMGDALAFRFD